MTNRLIGNDDSKEVFAWGLLLQKPIYTVNVQPDNGNSISVEAVMVEYLQKT